MGVRCAGHPRRARADARLVGRGGRLLRGRGGCGRWSPRGEARRGRLLRRHPRCRAALGSRQRFRLGRERPRENSSGPTSASRGATTPWSSASNNSGRGVGGSTVHYSMVAMRAHPDDFRRRTLEGEVAGADLRDWPLTFEDLEPYYEEVEDALQIAGPTFYPWGRRRRRYPQREHELNASAEVLVAWLHETWHPGRARADRHPERAARRPPAVRLPWLLQLRLHDQRQELDTCNVSSRGPSVPAPRCARTRWRHGSSTTRAAA